MHSNAPLHSVNIGPGASLCADPVHYTCNKAHFVFVALRESVVPFWDWSMFDALIHSNAVISKPLGEVTNCDALLLRICMYVYMYICITVPPT